MDTLLPSTFFSTAGAFIMVALLVTSSLAGISGAINLWRPKPLWQRPTLVSLVAANLLFGAGFLLICWFHYRINQAISLELPTQVAEWLNQRLLSSNRGAAYGLPLYDPAQPPRYTIPVWIENEKYFFWFMCYALMALIAHLRMTNHRFRAMLHLLLAGQVAILFFATDPFARPLPQFFNEITPWFNPALSSMNRIGLFMRLYPKMIFYYNAHYMWLHPPMLFLAYSCITLTFVTSSFMLVKRDLSLEKLGYDFAKFGYFMLTLGMLLGYPWALKAWGPNWWWDPKICSSIMMWAIFSTYLHTRLYANKKGMWYFSSALGILCFLAMIFTFITSFYFPGEHTFQ